MEISFKPHKEEESKHQNVGAVSPAHMNNGEEGEETRIKITLPSNAYFMSGIRDFTMQMVMNMTGFSEQWAYRFQSVVDELCNNAIEHGSGNGNDIEASFVSKRGQSIEVVVSDTQTGKIKMTAEEMRNKLKEKKETNHTFSGSVRGRGLAQIVSSWTDELTFTDNEKGGLTVRAKKYLDK